MIDTDLSSYNKGNFNFGAVVEESSSSSSTSVGEKFTKEQIKQFANNFTQKTLGPDSLKN